MEKKTQSYLDLEIYQLAKKFAVEIHRLTLDELPKFEMFEEGSQIRRSSKSIGANIVEGFGRKRYKGEYIRFLTYALASCDETKYHLEMLWETGSLGQERSQHFLEGYDNLGRKIYKFRQSIILSRSNTPASDSRN